jgi:hypothetical protein
MNRKLDLSRLRQLRNESPTSLIGMVRMAWPEIRAALDHGHSLKVVHERITEAGVPITYRRLSQYIARIRRGGEPAHVFPTAKEPQNPAPAPADPLNDPAANIRDRLIQNRPGFNFEPGPPDEDKLI